jgi:hypothetical protein
VERAEEKRLGYIKNAIMNKFNAGVQEVKISWPRHEIKYKGEDIYKTSKNKERLYSGVGKEVSTEVEAKVKDWLEKRQHEDSD